MYFFEQFGSGHSSSTGEGGGLPLGVAGVATTLVFLPVTFRLESSSPTLLFLLFDVSGRGGTNGVGDEGAVEGPEPLAPLRPFTPPPLRSLLCTDERVSGEKKENNTDSLNSNETRNAMLLKFPFNRFHNKIETVEYKSLTLKNANNE